MMSYIFKYIIIIIPFPRRTPRKTPRKRARIFRGSIHGTLRGTIRGMSAHIAHFSVFVRLCLPPQEHGCVVDPPAIYKREEGREWVLGVVPVGCEIPQRSL